MYTTADTTDIEKWFSGETDAVMFYMLLRFLASFNIIASNIDEDMFCVHYADAGKNERVYCVMYAVYN